MLPEIVTQTSYPHSNFAITDYSEVFTKDCGFEVQINNHITLNYWMGADQQANAFFKVDLYEVVKIKSVTVINSLDGGYRVR